MLYPLAGGSVVYTKRLPRAFMLVDSGGFTKVPLPWTVTIGHPVLFGDAPFAGELRRNVPFRDPSLDAVRNLDIGVFRPKGINGTSSQRETIGCSLRYDNVKLETLTIGCRMSAFRLRLKPRPIFFRGDLPDMERAAPAALRPGCSPRYAPSRQDYLPWLKQVMPRRSGCASDRCCLSSG